MSSASLPVPAARPRSKHIALALCLAMLSSAVGPSAVHAEDVPAGTATLLFRIVGPRDDITVGLTAVEFEAIGSAPGVERLARKLAADGQVTLWLYAVGRAPDGTTRFAPNGRVAIMRHDALRIEPYRPALPVMSPPGMR